MKVLQINSVCGYGSTGRITTDLYDVLEQEGHECCIAYGRGDAPEGYNTIKIGNKFDFYCHVLKTRLFDLHGFGSKQTTKKFIKQIKQYKPDIIHLHNIHGYFINIELLFEFLSTLDTPIVWQLHDAWSVSGHSAHFELENNNIPVRNTNKLQKKEYPRSYVLDNSKKNYLNKKKIFTKVKNMTIVTPSYWLGNILKKSFLSIYDIKVIHNGIDLTKFKISVSDFKKRNKLSKKRILLGVASVWNEKKGLDYFNQLAERLDEGSYQIILIGVSEKQKDRLNKRILGISRIESVKKLAEIYTVADIFVNPTLEDNFPTTNLESLACGTPVITFDTGGSSESINEQTGVVVVRGNFEKLYEAIVNFDYENKNKKACSTHAEKFDKFDRYNEYLRLYHTLIKKNKQ